MIYSVSQIETDVRVVLDENKVSVQLAMLGDVDTLSVTEIVRSKIQDAARYCMQTAPLHLLDNGYPINAEPVWDVAEGKGSGYLPLPDDFLRLRAFRMSDWERTVSEAITEDSPSYALQSSRYAGVRGNPQKPVVAVSVSRPEGLVLEFYSCNGGRGTHVQSARYLRIPEIEGDSIDFCPRLRSAVVYYAAYLVALTVKDDNAQNLLQQSKEFMQ